MTSNKKLVLELQELFKQKEYSKVVFEITSQTNEQERPSFLFNLLGLSRVSNNKKNIDVLNLAIKDFKSGYLKEKNTNHALDSLANFITTSVLLIDLEKNYKFDFTEILEFYKSSEKLCSNHKIIHLAMAMVYRRLNDSNKLAFHFDKIIKSKNFTADDLCNYGYWRCFGKEWSQADFLEYGSFVDKNLQILQEDKLSEISQETGPKIRIGFLSSDILQGHSITYFLKTVLQNYDKKKFEIILLLNNAKEDQLTQSFKNLATETINISNLDNISALNKIRELKLDITIDLMGYTSTHRIELLKNRLAKKQVIWMGYCNTSGLENMDYIITDPNLIYENEKNLYSEKVIYLPEIWNCHCGFDFERKENPPPFINNKYFTFGSFNNPSKMTDNVLNCWSNILKKVKGSKLIIKCSSKKRKFDRIEKIFKKNGVLDSVTFYYRIDKLEDHLNLYRKIDIALDTFPYNGVTTSFEAIWMGVPVLTMAGYNFNSRCGESINKNLNMEQLIAKDEDDYVDKAVNLSNNHNEYISLRKSVFTDSTESPLFNRKKFSENFFRSLKEIV